MEPSASLSLEPRNRSAGQTLDRAAVAELPIHPETLNQLTHAFGCLLSVIAGAKMLTTVAGHGITDQAIGCVVYVVSLIALYAASTLSHSFDDTPRRNFFRMIDQVCIFLLVVGTYTPFGLVHVEGVNGLAMLLGMWTFAAIGIIIRIRRGNSGVSTLMYLPLGWLPVLTLGTMYEVSGNLGLGLIFAGGLAYTGGTLLLVNDHRHPYLHAGWHLCTIIGSACHFFFLQWFVAEWPIA